MAKPPVLLRYRIGAGLILTALLPLVVALGFSLFDGIAGRIGAIIVSLFIAGVAASNLNRIGDEAAGPEVHDPLPGLPPLAAPFLLGLVLVVWPGIQGGLMLHQLRSVSARGISLAELAEHPEANIFELDDARIAMAQRGEVVSTTIQGEPDAYNNNHGNREVVEHLYAVAPLVGADWREGGEVFAWLILDEPGPAQLEGPVTVIRRAGRAEHREARAVAIEHHQLVSDPDAPLVELQSEEPRAMARSRLRFLVLVNVGAVALWLSISLAVWRRRRKAAGIVA